MASKSKRSVGLSSEQRAELTARFEKSKKFPNPYRDSGMYGLLIEAVVSLGVNQRHPLRKVIERVKKIAGKERYAEWASREKRNEETGLDPDARILQNMRVLQRTRDYGKKLLDVGHQVLKSKGAVID